MQRSGCKWTGITLSHEQLTWGQEKVRQAGLDDKIELRYQDYRSVSQISFSFSINRLCQGKYNKVVSVEMIEAVGKDFLSQYFEIINERLEDGGIAVLQVVFYSDH